MELLLIILYIGGIFLLSMLCIFLLLAIPILIGQAWEYLKNLNQ